MSRDVQLALAEAYIELGMLPPARRDRCANCLRFGIGSITGGKVNYRCGVQYTPAAGDSEDCPACGYDGGEHE